MEAKAVSIERLLNAAADASQQPVKTLYALASRLYGCTSKELKQLSVPPTWSSLNNDGFPFQLCHSLIKTGQKSKYADKNRASKIKLIADPYAFLKPGEERLSQSIKLLHRLIEEKRYPRSFQSIINDCINRFLPDDQLSHKNGYFWVASDIGSTALAVYFSPRYIAIDNQWTVVKELLESINLPTDNIETLESQNAKLASVAIQSDGQQIEIKIYWRDTRSFALENQPSTLFSDAALIQLLQLIWPEKGISSNGLLLSQSYDCVNQQVQGVKIDLCGHCLKYSNRDWINLLVKLNPYFNLSIDSLMQFFNYQLEIAFISFGLEQNGQLRCNLYWKAK